jgi:CRISPR-associated protein Csx10
MTTEALTLKAVSPIALHRRRASEQFAPTLDYLPGSAVRGALADRYLVGNPTRASETIFQQIFLSSAVRFSDFFPAVGKGSNLTRLLPATAVACKRFDDHHAASLSDSLLRLELVREWEPPDLEKVNEWTRCPECLGAGYDGERERLESGYYTSVESYERIAITKRMIAGTAIERATKTAAHAMLFSHEVIEESDVRGDVLFRGILSAPDELRLVLQQELLPPGERLAVGWGRSRGLGQLQVESWATPSVETHSPRERWDALNEAARKLWQQFDRMPADQYFSLTLQSHLALRDTAGQPILGEITAADLGFPPGVERCRCVLSAVAVPGWNAAQDLPKADTWALGRGTVLLFRMPPDGEPSPILERLEEIEEEGIGERRAEGFGRLTACDPFHSYFTLRELRGG